jgi:BMFP domain-containing protein YqiC
MFAMKKPFFLNANLLNDLTTKLCSLLPPDVAVLREDLTKNVHHLLEQTFAKLNLVTREEFDTQAKVLARSRERLEKLEAQLAELTKSVNQSNGD